MKNTLMKYTGLVLLSVTVAWVISCGERGGPSLKATSPSTGKPSFKISTQVPAPGDIEVDVNKPVAITFSDDVQSTTVNSTNLIVSKSGSSIAGTWSYDSTTKTATFVPTSAYPDGAVITVRANPGILKGDGTPLTSAQWSFTTVKRAELIAWWKFDGDGSDASGNGNVATDNNITFDTSVRRQGSASASFDGTSFFDVGILNLGDQFTITVWIYLPDPIPSQILTVISNGLGGVTEDGFKVFINQWGTDDRTVGTEAGDGTNGVLLVTPQNFVTLGAWKHLAVTINKNATNPSDRALFYFDGALTTQTLGPDSTLPAFPTVFATNQQTYLGKFPGDAFFYEGYMDDFRVYNRVLTPSEILRISQQN